MQLTIDGRSYDVELTPEGVTVDGEPFRVTVEGAGGTRVVQVNGRSIRVDIGACDEGVTPVIVEGQSFRVSLTGRSQSRATARPAARESAPARAAVKGAVVAQMTGRVVRVAVASGASVAAGDLLLVLEAMKMENEIRSPRAGTVKEVRVAAGDRVTQGDPLVVLDE